MIQLHASKALFAKLPVDTQGALAINSKADSATADSLDHPALTDNPLSGWQAYLFTLQRRQCILWVHGATRFPLFMQCLTKPDFARLQWLFEDTLMNTLLKVGANEQQMEAAVNLLRPLQIDSVCNRSEQGTLNRMKSDIERMLNYDDVSVTELSAYRTGVWLAERPTKIKGQKDYIWPQKARLALLDTPNSNQPLLSEYSTASKQNSTLPKNVIKLANYKKAHQKESR
jgi:hypothetical protein